MKNITGYKCDHCGKLYQQKKACQKHEDVLCSKHPNNEHPCWSCPYIDVSVVDNFLGDDPYSGEVWVKSKAFYCPKKNVNLYSYKFDKNIKYYDPAQAHEEKPLERMPSKLNPCNDNGGI